MQFLAAALVLVALGGILLLAHDNLALLGVLYLIVLGVAWLILRARHGGDAAGHHPYDNN